MFCTFTFDRGFSFWSGLLVLQTHRGYWGFHMGLFFFETLLEQSDFWFAADKPTRSNQIMPTRGLANKLHNIYKHMKKQQKTYTWKNVCHQVVVSMWRMDGLWMPAHWIWTDGLTDLKVLCGGYFFWNSMFKLDTWLSLALFEKIWEQGACRNLQCHEHDLHKYQHDHNKQQ